MDEAHPPDTLSKSAPARDGVLIRGRRAWRLTWFVGCSTVGVTVWAGSFGCTEVRSRGAEIEKGSALSISGSRLAIDGAERWLLGVSLFDALGPDAPRDEDLDALVHWGISLVRVWAHWNAPIYDSRGAIHAQGQARLLGLINRLRARGLVLELVLLRPGQLPAQPFALFASADARVRAVRAITSVLQPYRNALFDLYNEHDHPHGPISHRELRVLRDAVKEIDPDRLVTVSSTEYHFLDPKSTLDDNGRANVREEVTMDDGSVGVDLLAVHPPGTPGWAAATSGRIDTLRQALHQFGRDVPIYFNEGPRARPGEPIIPAEMYFVAASGTRAAGAAGWVFHTAAGYTLGERPFVDGLNTEERQALQRLKSLVAPRAPRR